MNGLLTRWVIPLPCEGRPLFSVEAVEANSHCTHSESQGKQGYSPGRPTYLPTKTTTLRLYLLL